MVSHESLFTTYPQKARLDDAPELLIICFPRLLRRAPNGTHKIYRPPFQNGSLAFPGKDTRHSVLLLLLYFRKGD